MRSPLKLMQYYKIRPRNVKVKGLILTRRHTKAEAKANGISRKAAKDAKEIFKSWFY